MNKDRLEDTGTITSLSYTPKGLLRGLRAYDLCK